MSCKQCFDKPILACNSRNHENLEHVVVVSVIVMAIYQQATILADIRHENIIKFYGAVTEDPDYYLITGIWQ